MIVLSKKRIMIIASTIMVAFFAFAVQNKEKNNSVQTVTLPVTNKVVVLDAGHGVPDEGDCLLTLIENN